MVKYSEEQVDAVFHALSDSTRRKMLRQLCKRELSISELAKPYDMSLVAAAKHVKVLERANLVKRSINGRTHTCEVNTATLAKADEWIKAYEYMWNKRFDRLDALLAKEK